MANPFKALWAALRDLFDEFFMLIVCNLIWVLISLPAVFFAYLALLAEAPLIAGAALLLGVLPAGPATAGLTAISYRVSDGRAIKLADFFAGMREFARQGWAVLGLFVAGMLVIFFNIGFYVGVDNTFGGLMLGLWVYLIVFWTAMLVYSFPLLFLQQRPDLRSMARNAALMVVGRPVFTIATLLLMAVVLVVSMLLVAPFVLIGPALLNLWSVRATRHLIEVAEARRAAAEAAAGAAGAAPPPEEKGRKGQVRPK